MRNRKLLLGAASIVFVCIAVYSARHFLPHLPVSTFFDRHGYNSSRLTTSQPVADGVVLSAANVTTYLDSILDSASTALPRLHCPAFDAKRYDYLRSSGSWQSTQGELKYFFALDLRNCLPLLPRLLGSIVEAVKFLGPQSCALSIIEGNSPDGTADVLDALKLRMEQMGLSYYFNTSTIDPSVGERITKLAELRNLALAPLLTHPRATSNTTVTFLNDVAACTDDILELISQRHTLNADMTCAMDWTYVGKDPTFYDVWVARAMNGDTFFEIPPDGNWNSAWNLFWNAGETSSRFFQQRPFQVFACWNGAVVFSAQPILEEGLRFREANTTRKECPQGEPQLFCKDMWFKGHGKIAVIPTVNLEYSDDKAKWIKDAKGYTSENVAKQDAAGDVIEWQQKPPGKVKCMPVWENQYWVEWNETLEN